MSRTYVTGRNADSRDMPDGARWSRVLIVRCENLISQSIRRPSENKVIDSTWQKSHLAKVWEHQNPGEPDFHLAGIYPGQRASKLGPHVEIATGFGFSCASGGTAQAR